MNRIQRLLMELRSEVIKGTADYHDASRLITEAQTSIYEVATEIETCDEWVLKAT